jgi:transposase-like protein
MGGSYSQEASSCVRFASRILAKEMKRIKELEAQGINPYESDDKPVRKTYEKEERIRITKAINEKRNQGLSYRKACELYDLPVTTYRKWKQRLKL